MSIGMNEIINGDCREVLPRIEKADLILTDPPYNIKFRGYNSYPDNMSEGEYVDMIRRLRDAAHAVAVIQYPEETMRLIVPALGTPDEVIAWCYNSNINRRFRLVSIYGRKPDFSRVLQPYKNPEDKRVQALIQRGSSGTPLYDWWSDIQLVKNVSNEKTLHPCPIPEKLVERLILMLTDPGQLVVDPFAGGGTVPFVAKKLGRKFYGVEKDPAYCDVARKRLDTLDVVTRIPIERSSTRD